jgi:hypothetical protein
VLRGMEREDPPRFLMPRRRFGRRSESRKHPGLRGKATLGRARAPVGHTHTDSSVQSGKTFAPTQGGEVSPQPLSSNPSGSEGEVGGEGEGDEAGAESTKAKGERS